MRTWNWKGCKRFHFFTKILLYPIFWCLFKFSENSFLYLPPIAGRRSASTPETTITQLSHSQRKWGIVRTSNTKPPSFPSQKQTITLKRKYSRSTDRRGYNSHFPLTNFELILGLILAAGLMLPTLETRGKAKHPPAKGSAVWPAPASGADLADSWSSSSELREPHCTWWGSCCCFQP